MPAPADRTNATQTQVSASAPGAVAGFGPPAVPGEVGTLGPYRLIKELGKGGMGAVYATLDTRLERRLALKVMLPEFAADASAKERFLREARAAARVKHDNVVIVYEADERNGVPYIAMEFLEGCPLDAFLKQNGPLAVPQVLRVAAETAAGLEAAHKLGLVHRDIKPANLWLEAPNGRVKVLDFGLAKPVDTEVELTKSGAVVGTPAYMSPEQGRGLKVDARSDLFSLGSVLYRLCTGQMPFTGPTTMAVLMALGNDEPTPVRDLNPTVPDALAALVHDLLAKNPNARPQSAAEVVRRVRAIASGSSEVTTSYPQVMQPQVVYAVTPVAVAQEANPFADLDSPETEADPRTPSAVAPSAEPPRRRAKWPWLVAGGAGLIAVAVVVALALKGDRAPDPKPVPPDDTAKKKDDGKKQPPPLPKVDPDRKAAEFVLSLGGGVRVNGQDGDLKAVADLPKERFTLTGVSLGGTAVTDAGLAHFKDCKSLTHLYLSNTRVSDAGLAHFKDCKNLTELALIKTKVSNVGLAHFTDCKNLMYLYLSGTQVSDAGLAHFKGCKGLTVLDLNTTGVTDAGLAHFKGSKGLGHLDLSNTTVTDAGLANFKDCKGLERLDLGGTAVTGEGLAHLKECKGLTSLALRGTSLTDEGLGQLRGFDGLTSLVLNGPKVTDAGLTCLKGHKGLSTLGLTATPVSDAGLAHLKDCPSLEILVLHGTRATSAGLAALKGLAGLKHIDLRGQKVVAKELADFHAAVPGCQILHDGGTIEPLDTDRTAAEWVLARGGAVRARGSDKEIKAAADLPKERFVLTRVYLNSTKASGAELANLKGLRALEWLDLYNAPVSDEGLVHVAELKTLTKLTLNGTQVSDAGLAHLKPLQALLHLDARNTRISDPGLARVRELKALTNIELGNTQVTDAGLVHLRELKGLVLVNVRGTKVTAQGAADLSAALPACKIEHDGGIIEPKK